MQYEAVIIGAGIMGLCTAYYLNQGGMKRILVVDREPYFGGYNTTRCAGGLRYQFADEMNIRLSQLSWSLMQETGQKAGISFQLNRCGYAFFITDRQREQSYLEAYHLQKALGVEVSLFQGEEFAQREPRLQYEGVRFITFGAEEGILDVHQVVSFLTDALQYAGVSLLCSTCVTGIQRKGSGFVLQTEHGDTFYTSRLVNAAGPWSSDISRMVGIDLPVARAFQQIFVTDPLPGISKAFPVAIYPDLGIGFHEEGGGILTQYNRPYEPNLSDRIRTDYNWFLAHAQKAGEWFPLLHEASVCAQWSGYYDETPDGRPIIGGAENLYQISGFNGHGFMHGFAAGKLLSEKILDNQPHSLCVEKLEKPNSTYQGEQREIYKV